MTKECLFTVVVGLGPTGLACVHHLVRKGCPVAVTDNRFQPPALDALKQCYPDIKVELGGFSKTLLRQAEQIVLSPGVSCREPLIAEQAARGVPVIGDVELFVRACSAPIIGITGSNGKTTVTTLFGEAVKAAGYSVELCGNIGQQALVALSHPAPDYYVMELSSFQLETTFSLKAKAAVLLNLSPDHMDRYESLEQYLKAKQRIYHGCEVAVVNADEPEIWEDVALRQPIAFSCKTPYGDGFGLVEKAGVIYLAQGKKLLLSTAELPLRGMHHYQNALAVLALGSAISLPMETMLRVLKDFKGIPHRCECIAIKKGVRWINDSKGTNAGASVAAIQSLGSATPGQLILLAGGDAKQADLSALRKPAKQYVGRAYLFGQDAKRLAAVLADVTSCHRVDSLADAVRAAAAVAKEGDTVLLSPACASFDMFDNYEHRGRVFAELVNENL